jgi:dihydroneopterin aldolase
MGWSSALVCQYSNRYHLHLTIGAVMDIIFLHDLTIETIIGIYDWERKEKQSIILDLDMGADIANAARTDAIEDTLNYKAVAKRLIEFVGDSDFQLVETLAERVAEIVLNEFDVKWLRLRVNKKGAVRYAGDVGIVIERGEQS